MEMDGQKVIARWGAVVDRFNEGDLGPLSDMLADDCVFHSSLGPVGTTKAEIIATISAGRDAGWTAHYPLGISAAGDFLTGVYRNDYADGSSVIAAAILRFQDDGKIVEIRSIEPPDFVAKTESSDPV
jgi:hypothetical protein